MKLDGIHWPVDPATGTRNTDKWGSGAFWASRDGGKRHHLGPDANAMPGVNGLSMITGKVTRLGRSYQDADYRNIVIVGEGPHEGLEFRVQYVMPIVTVGQHVTAGQIIGHVQDIAARYTDITPHIHPDLFQAIDWVDLMPRVKVGG